jgi:hypothetical protein
MRSADIKAPYTNQGAGCSRANCAPFNLCKFGLAKNVKIVARWCNLESRPQRILPRPRASIETGASRQLAAKVCRQVMQRDLSLTQYTHTQAAQQLSRHRLTERADAGIISIKLHFVCKIVLRAECMCNLLKA